MKASELIALARKQVGVRESPMNSNNVRYNTWYYGREVSGKDFPWCMVFVQWVFDQAGVRLPMRTASCGSLMRAAITARCWVTRDYKPGDIAIMDFPNNKVPTDHCGIVTAVTPVGVRTIEGNTAMGNDSNGGQVMERERMYGVILGAVRPEYDMEETMEEKRYNTVEECPDWAQGTVKKLVRLAYLNGSGKGLDLSRDMLRILVIQDRAGQFGS